MGRSRLLWLQLILENNTAATQKQTKPQAFHISLELEGDSSCYQNRSLPSHVPRERKGLLPPGEQTTGEFPHGSNFASLPFLRLLLTLPFENTIKAPSTFPVLLSRSSTTGAYTLPLMRDLKRLLLIPGLHKTC